MRDDSSVVVGEKVVFRTLVIFGCDRIVVGYINACVQVNVLTLQCAIAVGGTARCSALGG